MRCSIWATAHREWPTIAHCRTVVYAAGAGTFMATCVEFGTAGKRGTRTRSEQTRETLLLAAERVFAQHGISGTSLRQIALAADQHNTSVIQYHFRSKEGLILAILKYRVVQLDLSRERFLERISSQHRIPDGPELLEALCRPHLEIVDDTGRHSYSWFLSEYITRYKPLGLPHPVSIGGGQSLAVAQILQAVKCRLYYIPPDAAAARLVMCLNFFLQALIASDVAGLTGAALEAAVAEALAMAGAALMAPPAMVPAMPEHEVLAFRAGRGPAAPSA